MRDLYVVMTVSLISWIGIFLIIMRIDKRVKQLERSANE